MKHIKKRISKIVDELVTYLFYMGATDINFHIKEEEDLYRIHLTSNYGKKCERKIAKLQKCLNYPKQEEMEEYYWELAGECDIGSELTIVGAMTDKVEINLIEDRLEITLYRNKK